MNRATLILLGTHSQESHNVAAVLPVTKRSMIRSVSLSLAAVTGFSILVGIFVIPQEVAQLSSPYTVSVQRLMVDHEAQLLFAFCRCNPQNNEAPIVHQLSRQKLNQSMLDPRVVTELRNPTCVCPIAGGVIVAEDDGTIRRFSGASGASVVIGHDPNGKVWNLACSPDDRVLLAWGSDYTVWDLVSNKLLCRVPCEFKFALLSTNANTFFCDCDGDFVERDLLTGKHLRVLFRPCCVLAAALSPDGRRLATIGRNDGIQVTDLETGATIWERSVAGPSSASQLSCPLIASVLVFSPVGDRFLCAHEVEQSNRWGFSVWNARSGELEKVFAAHSNWIVGAQFVGPQSVYTWAIDCKLRKWDLETPDALLITEWNTADWRTHCD